MECQHSITLMSHLMQEFHSALMPNDLMQEFRSLLKGTDLMQEFHSGLNLNDLTGFVQKKIFFRNNTMDAKARVEWNLHVSKPPKNSLKFHESSHLQSMRKNLFARTIQRLCSLGSLVFVRNKKKLGPSKSSIREII